MQCNKCGNDLEPGVEFCGNCGAKLLNTVPAPAAPAVAQPQSLQSAPVPQNQPQAVPPLPPATNSTATTSPVPTPPASPAAAYAVARQPKNGFSIASLVLGILSCVTLLIFFFSIPFGILAIIFGFIGRTKGSKGMGIAGIILGFIGIVLSILIIAFAANYCSNNPKAESCSDSSTTQLMQPLRIDFTNLND